MTYTRQGGRVILEMTVPDYERLLMMLGVSLASARPPVLWDWVQFVNDMNRTNPDFAPYTTAVSPMIEGSGKK